MRFSERATKCDEISIKFSPLLSNFKTMMKILLNHVAFSECINLEKLLVSKLPNSVQRKEAS
jgi:hypothetical protein